MAAGERLHLCGAPGSRLAEALLVIAGFVRPLAGRIRLGDRDVTTLPPSARHIAFLPAEDGLLPGRSLRRNVSFPQGGGAAAIALLHLADQAECRASDLPPATMRLAALARALAVAPEALLIEEAPDAPPLSPSLARLARIDPGTQGGGDGVGCACVVTGAAAEIALAGADRILLRDGGRTLQVASPSDLYERPADRVAATWSGPCNLIPALLEGASTTPGAALIRIGGRRLLAPARALPPGPILLAVRPHRLMLDDADGLPATVEDVAYLGARTRVQLRSELGVLLVDTPEPPAFGPSTSVRIGWDWARSWMLPA